MTTRTSALHSIAVAGLIGYRTAATDPNRKFTERSKGSVNDKMMSESVSNIPEISNSVLERIGNTSLLQLRNIVPKDHARILIKLESENPPMQPTNQREINPEEQARIIASLFQVCWLHQPGS